jgi:hypothetical protein
MFCTIFLNLKNVDSVYIAKIIIIISPQIIVYRPIDTRLELFAISNIWHFTIKTSVFESLIELKEINDDFCYVNTINIFMELLTVTT